MKSERTGCSALAALLIATGLGSCRATPARTEPPIVVSTPAPAPEPPAPIASSAPVPSASASAQPVASPEPPIEEDEPDPPTYQRRVEDVPKWLREHHVTGWGLGDPCFEVDAGVPPKPALLCRKRALGTTMEHLYVFPSGRASDVWHGPIATWANWVDLVVEISGDGTELVLRDRRPGNCTDAYDEAYAKLDAGVHDGAFVQRIVDACNARGTYRWTGRKYVRPKK